MFGSQVKKNERISTIALNSFLFTEKNVVLIQIIIFGFLLSHTDKLTASGQLIVAGCFSKFHKVREKLRVFQEKYHRDFETFSVEIEREEENFEQRIETFAIL